MAKVTHLKKEVGIGTTALIFSYEISILQLMCFFWTLIYPIITHCIL